MIRDPGPRTSIVTSTAVSPAGPVVCILAGAVIGLERVLSTGESTNVPLAVEQVKRSRAGERRCRCRLADLPDLSREEIFWQRPASLREMANHER